MPLARSVLTHVASLCALSNCEWYIASAYREPDRQWELYKKGRKKVGVDWVRVQGQRVLTNAKPNQTPHCVTLGENPASCALDIALVSDGPEGRRWLSDSDPRWGIIGAAIALSGASEELSWGGMFRSIRDFPHVELKDWRNVRKGGT